MSTLEIEKSYRPLPPQRAFHSSLARIRGYGGAMGGGKSRALCEEAFRLAMQYPGLPTLIARERHTSIIETTRKTMFDQVIPPELLQFCKIKQSAGEDFIKLPNGSILHFIGLEDPVKWFSSEMGVLVFDEAHEISEDTVTKLITRLRWPNAPRSSFVTEQAPDGVQGLVMIGFNPENPGHWLHQWMILGGSQTEHGFVKPELWATGAIAPIGNCEFFFAAAADNPFLPPGYVETNLGGLSEMLRRRYLKGEWVYTSGSGFFDQDALSDYAGEVRMPKWVGHTAGKDARMAKRLRREGYKVDLRLEGKVRLQPAKEGPWQVWATPVRERWEGDKKLPAHRYIVPVDTSSGEAVDYSAIQVFCIETFAQVAEYQARIDPDLLALEAYRIGRVYNDALIVPEVTGGFGATIVRELERLGYGRIYTRQVWDRRAKKWTDRFGWDTSVATRMYMLNTLERVVRERELELNGARTLTELSTFVWDKERPGMLGRHPAARAGCNDDLVITLAMGVSVAVEQPRQLRREKPKEHEPQFAVTGY